MDPRVPFACVILGFSYLGKLLPIGLESFRVAEEKGVEDVYYVPLLADLIRMNWRILEGPSLGFSLG